MVSSRLAQFREAQLEAMIEEDLSSPLSVQESFGPKVDHGKWLERTLSHRGALVSQVRERILESAGLARDSLVLDLNGQTGLLAFEAQRLAPDGGVWVVALDDRAFETLTGGSQKLGTLLRPQIVRTDTGSFDRDIRKAAGKSVKFDAIVGRNVLTRVLDKKEFIHRVLPLLATSGVIVIAEIVPAEGQRLSELPEMQSLEASLKKALAATEKELFNDPSDPMVSWTVASLTGEVTSIPGFASAVSAQKDDAVRRLSPQEIEFWFRKGGDEITGGGLRPSLGERVRSAAGGPVAEKLRAALHAALDYKKVPWRTVTAIIRIFRSPLH